MYTSKKLTDSLKVGAGTALMGMTLSMVVFRRTYMYANTAGGLVTGSTFYLLKHTDVI
jgi:hypothetical protein